MEEELHKNNLRTLFGVENIHQNSQLRDILDAISSEEFAPIFKDLFECLRRYKHLEDYAIFPNTLLCVIDGAQYHSSKEVHCEQCLHKEHTPRALPRGVKTVKLLTVMRYYKVPSCTRIKNK